MLLEIILAFTSVVLLVGIILLVYKNHLGSKYYKNINLWTSRIEQYIPVLDFIRCESIYLMKETLDELLSVFSNYPKYFHMHKKQFQGWQYKEYIDIIESIFSKDFYNSYNNLFVSRKLHDDNIRELLDNIDNKSLDQIQREVVISDERNTLVIAGAGSGKTLTISGKVLYLVKEQKIDARDILLVTFTNKASEEMKERIKSRLGVNVKVYTFHKLGLEIITDKLGYKPSIAKEELLTDIISKYLEEEVFNDSQISGFLLDFFSYYFYTPFEDNEFNNLTDYYEEIKSNQLETLKDQIDVYEDISNNLKKDKITLNKERVKSYEELAIANFLYLNSVEYEYEKPYPKNLADAKHMQYRPDFNIPAYDIYIEHYGINKDNKVPWLNPVMEQEYLRSMKWKRELHKSEGNKYFESYSYYNREGILLRKLEDNLNKFGVKLEPKNKADILKQLIEKDEYFYGEFQNLITTFINQFKVNGYSNFNELIDKAKINRQYNNRTYLFLKIVEPIFHLYQKVLSETNQIDFNDMINDSKKLIEANQIELKYKYVIVDEYQDISKTRFRLIDAIRNQCNAKLVVVGDDWQSIYRFAGSDVNLITEFETINEKATVTKNLEKTYRNSQGLIDIVGTFIMKNKRQRTKTLSSSKILDMPLRIELYENNKLEAVISAVESIIEENNGAQEIVLLGRYTFDRLFAKENNRIEIDKYLRKLYNQIEFKFMTIHKSKGLEAEYVILLNADNSKLGFPSKINEDNLLNLVLPKKEPLKYAEERRLFYVALTRTKNTIYIIVPKRNPSQFIKELVDDKHLPNLFGDEHIICPRCGGAMIAHEEGYYYCSNYPLCDHTVSGNADFEKKCPFCNDYLVLRHGPYGDFYGCNSYKYKGNAYKQECNYTEKTE